MKYLKFTVFTLLIGVVLSGVSAEAFAQDRRTAVQSYNKALELVQNNEFDQAINMYNQAIAQAREAIDNGEEAADIVEMVEERLPQVYFRMAGVEYNEYQQNKTVENIDEAIQAFQTAADRALEYDSEQFAAKSENVVTQLYYLKSALLFQQGEFDQALTAVDEAIDRNSNYAEAYYQKGLILNKIDENNLEEFLTEMDRAISAADATGNSGVAEKARERAADELVFRGSEEIENENYDQAITLLEGALGYNDQSADAYYRLAEAANQQSRFNEALENANRALELESGGTNSKAKIYFEIGLAYKNLGNRSQACQAFQNAAYGSFKSNAEYEMEHELECEDVAG